MTTMTIERCPEHGMPDEPGCIHCEPLFQRTRRELRRGRLRGAARKRAADLVLRYVANDFACSLGGRLTRGPIAALHEAARMYSAAAPSRGAW